MYYRIRYRLQCYIIPFTTIRNYHKACSQGGGGGGEGRGIGDAASELSITDMTYYCTP